MLRQKDEAILMEPRQTADPSTKFHPDMNLSMRRQSLLCSERAKPSISCWYAVDPQGSQRGEDRMSRSMPINSAEAISTYILAKDMNRPALMGQAFTQDCELAMVVKTDAIAFPGAARGLEQVTGVLVRNFGDQYENVRTLCLCYPPSERLPHFRCDWLVGMSARANGAVRVGCGHYDWHFDADAGGRVNRLAIEIEVMCVLPGETLEPTMRWLGALPYPWCSNIEALQGVPDIGALSPIRRFLEAVGAKNATAVPSR
jgi:hypothetical protein